VIIVGFLKKNKSGGKINKKTFFLNIKSAVN